MDIIITSFGKNTFGTTTWWRKGLAIVSQEINSFSSRLLKPGEWWTVLCAQNNCGQIFQIKKKDWCLVGFDKAFNSTDWQALSFKMSKIGESKNMEGCTKVMYQDTEFCARCRQKQISSCAP